MSAESLSRLQVLQARTESAQFVFQLDPVTLVPVEIAAPAIGKSPSTFRSDMVRRPECLPTITRRGSRVLVRVSDILAWLDHGVPDDPAPGKRRVGRPTKAEQLAYASAAEEPAVRP